MRKRELYLNGLLCGALVVLLFGSFLANSEITVEGQCWGDLRESYTYNYSLDYYNYNHEEPLHETDEEIVFWDVESDGTSISYRTDYWEVFLGFVHCESPEEYDEYREAWEYENETESFRVTYYYDNASQLLGFLDPIAYPTFHHFIGIPMEFPINPLEVGSYLLGWYSGAGYTFLPVFHSNFSFSSDFQEYELAYPDFEIKFRDTFRFQGKKFEGYSYEYSFTFEEEIYPGLDIKEENEVIFSYNNQGILYSYYGHTKQYGKTTGDYELTIEGIVNYTIDSYDETLIVTHSWFYGIGAIIVTSTVIVYKRRKK